MPVLYILILKENEIMDERKYYELDLGKKHKDIYSYKVNPDINMNILSGKESQEFATTNSILDELNEFYECIANNTLPRVTATDGYNSIRLAEMILDKIKMKS